MYRNDPYTMLTIARLHQDEIRTSFPRRHRKWRPDRTPPPVTSVPPTGDSGAPTVPAPRQTQRETAAA